MVSKASAFKSPHTEPTVRLTVAQATIRFLANQYVERDGERAKFFAGCFGIFGHGNVAGIGQALLSRGRGVQAAGWRLSGETSSPSRHCDMCWAATNRPWSTPPPLTPVRRIGCRRGQ